MNALIARQQPDGCWEGEMVWCTVILSQTVIVRHVVGAPLSSDDSAKALRYYTSTRTPDGVWGMHPEGSGSVFVTSLAYIAHRLLGVPADSPSLIEVRHWLHTQTDGVAAAPSWGKFWLALLGLYDWRGVNPVPPEAFLLPSWLPFHPRRLYCHTRAIYIAMAYLYGRRFVADLGPLRDELKRELYGEVPIDFARHRHDISPTDMFVRPPWIVRRAYDCLAIYERFAIGPLRRRGLAKCFEEIVYEQRATNFQGISPVNGLLNTLAMFADGGSVADCLAGIELWRWDDADGLRYVGSRSQSWDTAFAMQAMLEALPPSPGFAGEGPGVRVFQASQTPSPPTPLPQSRERGEAMLTDSLAKGYQFLRRAQIVVELPDGPKHHRSTIRGGWCFTEGIHHWPVSDCTAEALEVILAIHRLGIPLIERISDERLIWAAEFILSRQNPDGGFGSYEERRGHRWLQRVNPSEMFARCMIEDSYVECTGSCVSALCHFRTAFPEVLREEVARAIAIGVHFIRKSQRPDGAWPAAWGIHFTYSIFFAVRGLLAAGTPANDPALLLAAKWLTDHQRADGAWGEHHTSALTGESVPHSEGQPAMTAWALLTLLELTGADSPAVQRGIDWLKRNQLADGAWPDGAVNGVFFGTSMLHYELYSQYFPAWALAKARGSG